MKNISKLICILVLSLVIGKANAQSDSTFIYTGAMQAWPVPACVTQITVNVAGAQGGQGAGNDNFFFFWTTFGGYGGFASGTLNVFPGQILYVYVGGYGIDGTTLPSYGTGGWNGGAAGYSYNNGGFYNGGGGGGGASDIRIGDTLLTSRVVVGGGGGGGGANYIADDADDGGPGGALIGGAGFGDYSEGNTGTGGGGTQSSGGVGGNYGTCQANNGTLGYGGADCTSPNAGAGGGGGYYGGGGGNWAGAGGGSNYVGGLASVLSNFQGTQTGDGSITISWTTSLVPVTDTGKVISHVTCNGANNGIATALVTGGTPSTYTYSWAPGGQTTDTVSGLSNGTYTITVNNSCGGSATSTVTITQPTALTLSGNIISDVNCNGGSNGAASATVGGGTMPYTYLWTSGSTRDTTNGLTAGFYKVIIIDNNGCSLSTTISITQPNILIASANNTANAHCGISNGSASSTVGGGVAPYTYSWTGGSTSSSISGLSGGTYMLNVMDNNGCLATSSVVVTETPAVFASAANLSNVSCNGGNDGSALANVTDGTAPYTYWWSNGSTNFTIPGLTAGTYTINITDANGCTSSAQTTVTQPTPINVVVDTTVDIGKCTGSAWVIVSGGVTPYSYVWSTGGTTFEISNECKGDYCCTITDGNGCTKEVCVHISSVAGVNSITSNSGEIKVYPNPNNGIFELGIRNYELGNTSIEVYNVLGEKVYSTNLNSPNGINTVNMGNQPNGIYLYKVMSKTGSLLGDGKIVLQK